MSYRVLFFFLSFIASTILYSQESLFEKLEIGDLVNTPSGSRSCNFLDINNDGLEDILITNGTSGGEDNLLYLNLGNDEFEAQISPVSMEGAPTDGSTCADYDNDGWIDIYAVNWHGVANLLYSNQADGEFLEVDTGEVVTTLNYSETASWGDADNDGLLDLYITNSGGNRRNELYRNTGTGYFQLMEDIVPTSEQDYSRNVTWTDYDLDGDLDLYITNENNQVNDLYRNEGEMEFTKILDSDLVSDPFSTMSSSWADIDNDGDLDVFLSNYGADNQLFIQEDGEFEVADGPWDGESGCSFSSNFADYDNDGDLDLFVTNGFCEPYLKNFLYENLGEGVFEQNLTEVMAIDSGGSYGCAWGDYNNDGFQDLVVANWMDEDQSNYLYKNTGNENHWVELRLEGVLSNRSAIGALVYCHATIDGESVIQMRELSAQTGYCGQNSLVVHFGLGDASIIDSIIIQWPSGIEQVLEDLAVDQLIQILEDTSTGINEFQDQNTPILVYPNPVDESLEVGLPGLTRLDLFDLYGRLIKSSDQERLSTHDIKAGQYILKAMFSDHQVLEQKIMIMHTEEKR